MIISKTPLRVSFAGGGSDLPAFYRRFGGAVLSTAINKYVYVTVNRKFDSGIRVAYSKTEEVSTVDQIEHKLVRTALQQLEVAGGVEITTVADIPSRGTGLGSSSSFTIALLQAMHAFCGRHASRQRLAEEACHLEINVCREPIGKQDQYAAAFGGFNLIEFSPDDSVRVSPIVIPAEQLRTLRDRMLLLYTGVTRSASDILSEQSQAVEQDPHKSRVLQRMVDLAYQMRRDLQSGQIGTFGDILHENWMLKKTLATRISNHFIDDCYETARSSGAEGGKLLGAGAGGFLLLFAEPYKHEGICRALPQLRPIPFDFDRAGSQIIFYDPAQEQTPKELLAATTAG